MYNSQGIKWKTALRHPVRGRPGFGGKDGSDP
jgi:hypothetical protein